VIWNDLAASNKVHGRAAHEAIGQDVQRIQVEEAARTLPRGVATARHLGYTCVQRSLYYCSST
jgi:hypothetical protein